MHNSMQKLNRDSDDSLLENSVIVSIMTCAAPMVRRRFEGLTNQEYREMLYNRITGMLKVAARSAFRCLCAGTMWMSASWMYL